MQHLPYFKARCIGPAKLELQDLRSGSHMNFGLRSLSYLCVALAQEVKSVGTTQNTTNKQTIERTEAPEDERIVLRQDWFRIALVLP